MNAAPDCTALALAARIAHEATVTTASFTAALAALSAAPLAVSLATAAAELDATTRAAVESLRTIAREALAGSVRMRRFDFTTSTRRFLDQEGGGSSLN